MTRCEPIFFLILVSHQWISDAVDATNVFKHRLKRHASVEAVEASTEHGNVEAPTPYDRRMRFMLNHHPRHKHLHDSVHPLSHHPRSHDSVQPLSHHPRSHDSVQHLSKSGDDLGIDGTSSFLVSHDVQATAVRPNAGGPAEKVKFGLFGKNFYGADLKSNTFRLDVVMSLRWRDKRVIHLVPDGLERVVLSDGQAAAKIWVPDMVFTNRELGGMNIISSSVEVYKSGEIQKVERAQVRVSNKFELDSYPFDNQEFRIKIASGKYMSNDLVLVPMRNKVSSGLRSDFFEGDSYYLKDWNTTVYEEADGDLLKSRGMLEVKVSRNLDKYTQDHLVPTGIVLMISWSVFYFPFAAPFITPRLVLSIVALLTFTNLMIKSGSLLPGACPFNWNDLFNQLVQALMFVTIVINIFSEICFHQFKVENLARQVNHEAKVLQPILSLFCITFILSAGKYRLMSLWYATLFMQTFVTVTLGSYVYYSLKRFSVEKRKAEGKRGLSDGGAGGGIAAGGAAADCGADADAGGAGA